MENIKHIKNPYGYKVNINHPEITEFYAAYKRQIADGVNVAYPISNTERFRFECILRQAYKLFREDKEKCDQYIKTVISKIKPLDWKRIREERETDRVTRFKVMSALTRKAAENEKC